MTPQPRYPIYVITKGRAEHPYTIRALSKYQVPFFLVVEDFEISAYQRTVDRFGGFGTILELDRTFQRDYDACMALAPRQGPGSGPARNFAWDHALRNGHPWYWCVDDNIQGFWYYTANRKAHAGDANPICQMENFVDRFENIAMAGPNYYMFVSRKNYHPPFVAGTRIYSCNLIRTDLPQRWRGRYNEDTILSLDLLKAGWQTVLFNAFLQWKLVTQSIPGGNTTELYGAGTLEKSKMLVREHPDVARLAHRFGRDHHHVDYREFMARPLIQREVVGAEPLGARPLVSRERAAPLPLRDRPDTSG